MSGYMRHWKCERCGKSQESIDWPQLEVCDACEGLDLVVDSSGPMVREAMRDVAHRAYQRGYRHGKQVAQEQG